METTSHGGRHNNAEGLDNEAIDINREKELTPTIADGKLNKAQQGATGLDQSSHGTNVLSNNHAADTHDDRAGRSHVDCLDHQGEMELDEKEYWRPSYMFNWLRAAGWDVKDAYQAFETYRGKASYEQMNLQPPVPMNHEDGYQEE